MKRLISVLVAVGFLSVVGTAAAQSPTLSGGATLGPDGVITLVSNTGDAVAGNDSSSATFTLPAGTTFAQLATLGVEFNVTDDGCAAGSPRITIHLASGKNVFVYLGAAADVNSCPLNQWISWPNLIGNADNGRYDTSQVQAGTQVTTYAAALALINGLPAGEQIVSSVSLDVDAGYAFDDKEQTVLLRKLVVNGLLFTAKKPKKQNPAQLCRAQQQADPAGFKSRYGTNKNKANAFGKCVSRMAKAVEAGAAMKVHQQTVKSLKAKKAAKAKAAAKAKGKKKGR